MSQHFIGNRAIYMLGGQESFQIAYSTNLTVMSLLVPILVLILAFLGVSGSGRIQWWRIGLAGLLSGGAICGMHYLADSSISNYKSSYQLSYLIGSVIISWLASTTALALFFVFESTWSSAWWKRLGCAMVLAGAVSGMHWCAAVGTSYTLLQNSAGKGVSRQDAMVVVICLVSLSCVFFFCFLFTFRNVNLFIDRINRLSLLESS
jgi:NO-binding membrane sensor protein with MHYT domain